MNYSHIDNSIIFPFPPTLIKWDLWVKSFAYFIKDMWKKTWRRTQQQQLSQGSFGPFPLCLNPKLHRFDLKSSYFSMFKTTKITKTYLSQIIKSKDRKLEARKQRKLKNLVQKCHKLQQFQPQNISIFLWTSSPGMRCFTNGFL